MKVRLRGGTIPYMNWRKKLFHRLWRLLRNALIILVSTLLLWTSSLPPGDRTERARYFTRAIEFDYVAWTFDALRLKLGESVLGTDGYLANDMRHKEVVDYLELVNRLQSDEGRLAAIYADPTVTDKQIASATLRRQLEDLRSRRDSLAPVAEAVLQSQISSVVARLGLSLGGQPIPPMMYRSTPLPLALIISPRNVIRQDDDISLAADFGLDKRAALEDQVDHALGVSSLVVNIGGVGVYPTMVYQTSDLIWLSETVSHEWVHNFLTLRPLGISYLTSPELRTMNETAANIAGKEIGRVVIREYYPELASALPPEQPAATQPAQPDQQTPPAFDFNKEMHTTRVQVDKLLAEGKIEQAETYMEQRRVVFWQQGYTIRKLNQAYFAFHGAYADQPDGGAAGEDPVGAAVRMLRSRSGSLADFINKISWMSSYNQLKLVVR